MAQFCIRCGRPLHPGAGFCAQCGTAIPNASAPAPYAPFTPYTPGPMVGSAPLAIAPVAGAPPWPYPEHIARKAPTFNLIFGIAFLASGLLVVPMLLMGLSMGSLGDVAPFLAFLAFPLIGVGSLRAALRERATARELFTHGVRCWARIASITPGSGARVVNGMRYPRMVLEVDAFAAHVQTAASYRQAPTTLLGRVKVDWFVAQHQLMQATPGSWCALLVDPRDPTRHQLEGFAAADGTFTALW